MIRVSRILLTGASLAGVACASHQSDFDRDVLSPAAVRANVRVVNAETTWVAEGSGYELVGRSKAEIAAFEPSLDRLSATLHRVFPKDSFPHITATVRRMSSQGGGQSFGPAPVPGGTKEAVVELMLVDRRRDDDRKNGRVGPAMVGAGERVRPVLRAWLAAHAAKVTGNPARYSQLTGEEDDPRVPSWTYEMLPLHADTTATDNLTRAVAEHPDDVIPLSRYFMMLPPAFAGRPESHGSGDQGAAPAGGEGGMGGGRGGRGMGGGGMGRGGGRRGGSSGGEGRPTGAPLEGLALYAAQSAALGHYLSREGDELIGQLIDAQIQGQPLDAVFAAHSLGDVDRVDTDFRSWVLQHGSPR